MIKFEGSPWQCKACLLAVFVTFFFQNVKCLLFPRESESREIKELNGVWNFRADNSTQRNLGFENEWWLKPLEQTGHVISMPVPSSYNDITQDRKLRDFVGWVWYDKQLYVSKSWKNADKIRAVLRIESCSYYCIVWLNGKEIMKHEGGHLPFESDVSENIDFGELNRITIAVNNTLTPTTLPPGSIEYMKKPAWYPPGYFVQNYEMDFFNYAGIHRPVKLFTTPTAYLADITIQTDFKETIGMVLIEATIAAMEEVEEEDLHVTYTLYNANNHQVASAKGTALFKTVLNITDVELWWPIGMSPKPAYLYTLKVETSCKTGTNDVYRIPVGIRTIDIKDGKFLINEQEFYFRGFGRHEDADIRGKGLDLPLLIKDYNLMKWMGANSFRTSHYPYAEEDMYMADEEGFVVIDESPGVGIGEDNMEDDNLRHHLEVMKELVQRDKNHPSVVMWSVANEPRSDSDKAERYFKKVIGYTRDLDSTRPVTFVTNQRPDNDKAVKYTDVICINRYYAWYHDAGAIELIQKQFDSDLNAWHDTFQKPVLQAEYGADALSCLHQEPSVMFSAEYQVDTIKEYFPIFDKYRKKFFVGEMIWNFADFATKQETTRVAGNKKGMFTRQRQPKMAAHILRERYLKLLKEESNQWDDILGDLIRE